MSSQAHGSGRMTRRLLVVDEVAELLRENPETVRRLARRHEIPGAMNIGTDRRPKWAFRRHRHQPVARRGDPVTPPKDLPVPDRE